MFIRHSAWWRACAKHAAHAARNYTTYRDVILHFAAQNFPDFIHFGAKLTERCIFNAVQKGRALLPVGGIPFLELGAGLIEVGL